MTFLDQPVVSYRGLGRANKVLRLIVRYYWPLHGLGINEFLNCHPVLSFIAAVIHQTDDEIEGRQKYVTAEAVAAASMQARELILHVLKEVGATDQAIACEIERGGYYLQQETALVGSTNFTLTALREALLLRSSDLRLLHRVSLHLLHRLPDPRLFDLIQPLEVMAEMRDDLYQYHDDIARGTFNTYVLLERKYGAEAPLRLQQERDHFEDVFLERMQEAPADLQRLVMPLQVEAFDRTTFQPPTVLQPLP